MKTNTPWVSEAERETGFKWNELSIFDKLQYQKRYSAGRAALGYITTPVQPIAYPRSRRKE